METIVEHGVYPALAIASFISAVFPVVNAELMVLGLAAGLPHPNTLLLIGVATGSQMAGKSTMYWVGRRVSGFNAGRYATAIDRWGHRFRESRTSVGALVFLSSASGFPPFYVISTLAGVFRTDFVIFLLVGSVGRFLHFAAIGLFPSLVRAIVA